MRAAAALKFIEYSIPLMTDHSSPHSNPATPDLSGDTANDAAKDAAPIATNGAASGASADAPTFRVPEGAPQGTQARGALNSEATSSEAVDNPASDSDFAEDSEAEAPSGDFSGASSTGTAFEAPTDAPQSTLDESAATGFHHDDLQGEDDYEEPWNDELGPRIVPDELPEEFVDWPENSPVEVMTDDDALSSDTPTDTHELETATSQAPLVSATDVSNDRVAGGWEPPTGSGYESYPAYGASTNEAATEETGASGESSIVDGTTAESTSDHDTYTYHNEFTDSGSGVNVHDALDYNALATSGSGDGGGGGADFGGTDLPPDDDARVPSHYQESLDPNAPVNDREQDLIEHLAELRTRILHSVLAVVIMMMGTWAYGKPISEWFSRPIREALKKYGVNGAIITTDPMEGFMTQFQIAFVASILITMPFLLFQIWRFVEPALTHRERRFTGTLVPFAVTLFFLGCGLGYAVSPLFFQFFLQYQPPESLAHYSYGTSILILAKMLLVFGVCFQVPVVVIFLHKAGVVSRNVLIEYWRHVIVVIFTVVAVLTPTWDPLTLVVCGAPPCLLYVGSIWLIKWL
ncbi:MAG: sec-independent protein translocase protein TatC [Abditibacteriota bacterium]|nr:sec-independent protein translocase protein TatC [Abditibacteriota bacterium]